MREEDKGLFGSRWDFILLGGGSLGVWLVLAILHFTGVARWESVSAALGKAFIFIVFLDLLVNLPHFIISYRLAYFHGGRFVYKNQIQLLWAPLILIAILMLSTALAFEWPLVQPLDRPLRRLLRGLGVSGMSTAYLILAVLFILQYVTVGWHYSKQAFGTAMFRLRAIGQPLTEREGFWLKTSLMTVWFSHFTSLAMGHQIFSHAGVTYTSLGISPYFYWASLITVPVSLGSNVFLLRKVSRRHGKNFPDLAACGSIFSVYCWFSPALAGRAPGFVDPLGPFFHSLQYLSFACRYEVNNGQAKRRFRLLPIFWVLLVYGLTVGAGVLFYRRTSASLDLNFPMGVAGFFGAQFFVFLNLHHYFIDNAIWRRSNPEVRGMINRR